MGGTRKPINKLTVDQAYEQIRALGVEPVTPKSQYKDSITPIKMRDSEGHVFERSLNKLKTGTHKCCGSCAKKLAGKTKAHSYEDIKSYIESKGAKLLSKTYSGHADKLDLVGTCKHQYSTTWAEFRNQDRVQCRSCGIKLRANAIKKSAPTIEQQIAMKGYILRSDLSDYTHNHGKLKFECPGPNCKTPNRIFERTLHDVLKSKSNLCQRCAGSLKFSSIEEEVSEFIESLGFRVSRNDRKLIAPKELDIYVPDKKIAIEVDGVYFHSDINNPDPRHLVNKTDACLAAGISLIHVYDKEWQNQGEIIRSMIAGRLGVSAHVIDARKCEVVWLNSDSKFMNDNHLQGASRGEGKVVVALSYQGEVVSMMSLAKSRFDTGHQWEILRFCSRLNTSVRGAAGKLFAAFAEKHSPKSVVSYSDRRFGEGGVYERIGFSKVEATKPSYFYIKGNGGDGEMHSRYKFQKHKMDKFLTSFDESKSELENARDNGYNRVYNCGHNKLSWTRQKQPPPPPPHYNDQ